MRDWMGQALTSLLIIAGFFGYVGLSAAASASADSPSQLRSGVRRDGECSPSLSFSDLDGYDWFLYLPVVMQHWPPVPDAPVLQAPGVVPVMTTYALTWTSPPDSVQPTYYLLEEATSPDFYEPLVYTTTEATKAFADRTWGDYHYRVRGFNGEWAGPWSNTGSVYLAAYNDPFNGPVLPWAPRRTSSSDMGLMTFTYGDDSTAKTKVEDRFDFAIFSPMIPAPPTPYRLRMASRIIHEANLVSYGIVWGASAGDFCEVECAEAADPDGCFSHYYRLNVVWGGTYWKYNIKRIDYHEPDTGAGRGETLVDWVNISGKGWDPRSWHIWEVRIYEDHFQLYVNDQLMNTVSATRYVSDPYYGIFSSTNEYNSADFEHDYFIVRSLE
ncbi:MAG: hypothetical protein ACP5HS_08650 [Anaerolineae bacterium]